MKDRPRSSYGAVYVPPHHRLRSVITTPNYTSSAAAAATTGSGAGAADIVDSKLHEPPQTAVISPRQTHSPYSQQEQLHNRISHFNSPRHPPPCDDSVSEEGSDRELDSFPLPGASPFDNIDEWTRKFTMLLRDKEKQEFVSREKKDRRDFEQISDLASRMGLYSHLYAKVVVFSKVPLPNYRFDLDDKRPQREVALPLGLLRRVDSYFGEYLSQKSKTRESYPDISFSRSNSSCSIATDEGLFEQPEPLGASKSVMEKIHQRRSLQLRDQQRAWQESPEGRKMLEFRRSLPAYKEKNTLLTAVSRNQISIHPCLLKYHGLSMEMVNLGSIMLMMNHALILMQFLNKTISNKMKSIWHVHAAPLTATEG